MARDLRRRLKRLEAARQPDGALVREWIPFIRALNDLARQWDPEEPRMSQEDVVREAQAQATTGQTPRAWWTHMLIKLWEREPAGGRQE